MLWVQGFAFCVSPFTTNPPLLTTVGMLSDRLAGVPMSPLAHPGDPEVIEVTQWHGILSLILHGSWLEGVTSVQSDHCLSAAPEPQQRTLISQQGLWIRKYLPSFTRALQFIL